MAIPASGEVKHGDKIARTGRLLSKRSISTSICKPAWVVKMADKLRTQQELERLQAKYVGTGHADTSSWEWRVNRDRDTLASIVGHPPLLAYNALALNEPQAKLRAQYIRKMIQPSDPPPPAEEEA